MKSLRIALIACNVIIAAFPLIAAPTHLVTAMTDASTNAADDDATAINAKINLLSSTVGGTIYLPSGIFHVKSEIVLKNKTRLIGAGKGQTKLIYANTVPPTNLDYVTCIVSNYSGNGNPPTFYNEVSVKNISFSASVPLRSSIRIRNCSNVTVADCSFDFNLAPLNTASSAGVYGIYADCTAQANGLRIRNCTFDGIGNATSALFGYGICVLGTYTSPSQDADYTSRTPYKGVFIQNCVMNNIGRTGIYVRDSDFVEVLSNTVNSIGYGGATESIAVLSCFDATVEDNATDGWLSVCNWYTDNKLLLHKASSAHAMEPMTIFRGQAIRRNKVGRYLELHGTKNAVVDRNIVGHTSGPGIGLDGTSHNSIGSFDLIENVLLTNNTVKGTGSLHPETVNLPDINRYQHWRGTGIKILGNAHSLYLADNSVESCVASGIGISGEKMIFESNSFSGNRGSGVLFESQISPTNDRFAFIGKTVIEDNGHVSILNANGSEHSINNYFGVPGDSQYHWPGDHLFWEENNSWSIAGNYWLFPIQPPQWTLLNADARPESTDPYDLTPWLSFNQTTLEFENNLIETRADAESVNTYEFLGPRAVKANTWCEYVVKLSLYDSVVIDMGDGAPIFGTATSNLYVSFLHNYRRAGVYEPTAIIFGNNGIPKRRIFLRSSTIPKYRNTVLVTTSASIFTGASDMYATEFTRQSLQSDRISGQYSPFNGVNLSTLSSLPGDIARNLPIPFE